MKNPFIFVYHNAYRNAQSKISYDQKQQGQCYHVTFLIVFLKEVRPTGSLRIRRAPFYTLGYQDILSCPDRAMSKYLLQCGHPQKKKEKLLLNTEYFQSKIYIRSLARSCKFLFSTFQCFSSRPKRLHPLCYFL